jgi:hypothetical protein
LTRILFAAVTIACAVIAWRVDELAGFGFGVIAGMALETLRT